MVPTIIVRIIPITDDAIMVIVDHVDTLSTRLFYRINTKGMTLASIKKFKL